MRWADLGDHCQGIKWIKCFNPLQQEKKKSWMTDRQAAVSKHETLAGRDWLRCWGSTRHSACLKSSGESEVDFAISCWRARAPHYIIHMLHNNLAERHTHTHTHIYSQTQTHMLKAKLGLPWMPLLQMFLLCQFPVLLQSMFITPCVILDRVCIWLCIMCNLLFVFSANITAIQNYGRK